MRITIFLPDAEAERLEELAREEHRSVRQQATVLILKALELSATDQPQTVAA